MAADEVKQLLGEGTQLLKDGKLDEAIAKLKAAVELDPSHVQAHSYLGAAYAKAGQNPASVEQFQAAVDLDPDNPALNFNLGQAFESAGSKPRAKALYEKALALDPNYARAQQRLDALTGGSRPAASPAAPSASAPQPTAQTSGIPGVPPMAAQQPVAPPAAVPAQHAAAPTQYGVPPQPVGYGAPPPTPGPVPMAPRGNAVAEHSVKIGSQWLYAIAVLSLVNTTIVLAGSDFQFSVGLGITSVLNFVVREMSKGSAGSLVAAICLPITFFFLALYAVLGYCGSRGMRWAFITATVLYGLDTILVLFSLLDGASGLLGIAIHIWALIRIIGGIGAAGELGQLRAQQQAFERAQAYQQRSQPPSTPMV